MQTIVSVWPSVEGLKGINPSTLDKVKLLPFRKQFMYDDDAKEAESNGDVQIMVGLRPCDLKQPTDEPVVAVEVKPEPAPAPPKKKTSRKRTKKAKASKTDDMLD